MFRVIRMMNSAGPGATGVKKERDRGREKGRVGKRKTETDRHTESEKSKIMFTNYTLEPL